MELLLLAKILTKGVAMNLTMLSGFLGNDATIRVFPESEKGPAFNIISMDLATSKVWRDRTSGESKEKTTWHKVVLKRFHAENVNLNLLKKGTQVSVRGEITHRKYKDNGVERFITEIVVHEFQHECVIIQRPFYRRDVSHQPHNQQQYSEPQRHPQHNQQYREPPQQYSEPQHKNRQYPS